MAVLLNQITVGDYRISVLDSDPSTGIGHSESIGSLAIVDGSPGLWQKFGSADTDWQRISADNETIQDVIGNVLIDSVDIDFQYNDLANTITAVLTASGVTAGTYGDASNSVTVQVDTKGRITSISNAPISITSGSITDFDEAAQDAVGNALIDSSTINFTYDDSSNTITADVVESNIVHANLSGLAADDHTQYALLAGRPGGQTLNGGDSASETLVLSSTSNTTKGVIQFGTAAAIDEANLRLGVGTIAPDAPVHIVSNNIDWQKIMNTTTTTGNTLSTIASVASPNNSVMLLKVYVTGLRTDAGGLNQSVAYERTLRVKNNAGTVSILTVQSDYTSEDAALKAANVSFVVTGTNVDVRVLGVTGADITWKCIVDRML